MVEVRQQYDHRLSGIDGVAKKRVRDNKRSSTCSTRPESNCKDEVGNWAWTQLIAEVEGGKVYLTVMAS